MIGHTISHYEVMEKIGAGGMGLIYKARDLRLNRLVALKFLPIDFGADQEHRLRFEHEAKSASALDHPNICTIYEIDQTPEGQLFIAMAYYEGETLKSKIEKGPLPLEEAVDTALQVANGLAKAHSRGLVHRDIKPANIIITTDGAAKILDFGLAKGTGETELTRTGTTLGTAAYMSPEQAQGGRVDARTDVWSLGVVLYEMLSGTRPFRGDNLSAVIYSVINTRLKPVSELRPGIPPELDRILSHALEKNPNLRYPAAADFERDLSALGPAAEGSITPSLNRRISRIVIPLILALIVLAAGLGWFLYRNSKTRWAREKALPEVGRLIDQGNYVAAFDLARQAESYISSDPILARMWGEMSEQPSIESTPSGADVAIKEYADPNGEWRRLGRTPLKSLRIPRGYFRWRISMPGFETMEVARGSRGDTIAFMLHPADSVPPDMVSVPAGVFQLALFQFGMLGPFKIGQYWLDKFEVTNREFKEFINHGGYEQRQYWKQTFIKDGRPLAWEEAIKLFKDSTGRPGPSTWEAGVYPAGKDDYPVAGVSWYEAAAYAEYAGKRLPTLYHWYRAAGLQTAGQIVPLSNFGGSGLERCGSHAGMGPFGTSDMAGNAKEWCWNETEGKRYVLGGAWNEPTYMFSQTEARDPWDRSSGNGFRCMKSAVDDSPDIMAPIDPRVREYSRETPVSDETFRVFRSMYARQPGPLDPRIESTDSSSEYWTLQKLSLNADSPTERMPAYLALPKDSAAPYQVLVFFPGGDAVIAQTIDASLPRLLERLDFVLKSGRAMMFPVWKGTWDRYVGPPPLFKTEMVGQWMKDLGASIDYLESRNDIDPRKIGYAGVSMGAQVFPKVAAFEPRVKLAVLLDGGFISSKRPPEVDEINYVTRIHIPVLMVNGRYDFIYPLDRCQIPMFRLLGTPAEDKKHVILDSAHDILSLRSQTAREVLDWLDRYFGQPAR